MTLTKVGAMGFSAMMHGYMAFDKEGKPAGTVPYLEKQHQALRPKHLTELFQDNIPQRWSIAHLYQVILNDEEHVKEGVYHHARRIYSLEADWRKGHRH